MFNMSDIEIIEGIQRNDEHICENFYRSCHRYYMEKRSGVLSFKSNVVELQDLFQDSFLILWTEIQSKKIHIRDNYPCRFDMEGHSRRMSANLHTYLMSIAKYKNFEILRETELFGDDEPSTNETDFEEEPPEISAEGIVALMVNSLPQRCKEILTLFYYEQKTLDEILAIREENTSKDGLKSGKSKCMTQLKSKILVEFNKYHLKPYQHG
jgi:hypothetical protein